MLPLSMHGPVLSQQKGQKQKKGGKIKQKKLEKGAQHHLHAWSLLDVTTINSPLCAHCIAAAGMERPETDRPVLRGMLLNSLQPGTVQWGHQLTAVHVASSAGQKHVLRFANGQTQTADVVIGADGARSKIRPILTNATPSYRASVGLLSGFQMWTHVTPRPGQPSGMG